MWVLLLGGEDTLGVLRDLRNVATKEEEGPEVPPQILQNSDVSDLQDDDGEWCEDPQSPVTIREQRVARTQSLRPQMSTGSR